MPQPLTDRLEAEPLIDTAIVVGSGQKYCTALVFLSNDALMERYGRTDASVLSEPGLETDLQRAVATANADMPHWSTIKKAAVVTDVLTMESGEVTLSIKREAVLQRYQHVLKRCTPRSGAGRAVFVSLIEVECRVVIHCGLLGFSIQRYKLNRLQ